MGKEKTSPIEESAYDFVVNGKEPPKEVVEATLQRSEEVKSNRPTSSRTDLNQPEESSETSLDTGKK